MDWSEERYVRLYTRDTVDWTMMPWQSRALLPLLVRKGDKTGAISTGKSGRGGLAELLRVPMEFLNPGLDGLVADGCVEEHAGYVIMPNFIEAQETEAELVTRF